MHVIGTAGHVDHGKSTLVKALTGIDPDRLQEEQEREMTIDLGFAWLTLPSGREVSVVDVPGHERFIKNMLAGVGGIDLAVLVVAADESVMPQTREHLAILDLLQVKRGVVALTKTDLVEQEWIDLVAEDLQETLKGTTLEEAPLVPVSAVVGQGLDELKALLDQLLEETPPRRDLGRPRLAVDRVFTMTGFGTVVTGTLLDGSLNLGQEVELVPSGLKGRVRGLQSHRQHIDQATPGRRLAVNLSGISHDEIERGEVLTCPGWLSSTVMVDIHLRVTPWSPQSVKHNMGVTFHTGTSETTARLRLLDAERLDPGQEGWAQLRLIRPVPLVKGDPFVVRSSQWTLGGGQVVDTGPRRHRRFQAATLDRLEVMAQGSPRETLLQTLAGSMPVEFSALVAQANLSPDETRSELEALIKEGLAVVPGNGALTPGTSLFSTEGWTRLTEKTTRLLGEYHGEHPLRLGIPREELRNRLELAAPLFPQILDLLASQGSLLEEGALVRAPDHQVMLSPAQERGVEAYLQALEQQPFSPPTDLSLEPEVLGVLVSQGRLVRVNDEVAFTAKAYREMEDRIVGHLKKQRKITVADVRDMFSTSRKYALPLMEYLDQRHITRRVGDERVLVRPS